MLADVLPLLRCPHCAGGLRLDGRTVRCPLGHGFDVARQGYVNLLPGGAAPGTADTPAMVAARAAFLAAGHYDALSDALAAAAAEGPVLDLGAGTGHHLARVLDRVPGPGIALDLSAAAARRAARASPRVGAVVADAWRALPVGDGAVGTVLTVFAPRAPAETARVLRPGGRLVVAAPTPEHLVELVAPLGLVRVDPDKQERLDRALAGYQVVDRALVQRRLVLTPDDVRAAVAMGPSARHVDAGALTDAALARLPRETTLSVSVTGYEPVLAAR